MNNYGKMGIDFGTGKTFCSFVQWKIILTVKTKGTKEPGIFTKF